MSVVLCIVLWVFAGSSGQLFSTLSPELPASVSCAPSPDAASVVLLKSGAPGEALALSQVRSSSQRQKLIPSTEKQTIPSAALDAFKAVEHGLAAGTIEPFSELLASRVFIQLRGAEGGYHTATQAYYILTSFLKTRKPLSVVLTTYGSTDGVPYATGGATFVTRGVREDLQVYVALHPSGERWVISHLNIY